MATTVTVQPHACTHCGVTEQYTVCSVNDNTHYFCWDCLEDFVRGITDAYMSGYRSGGTVPTFDTVDILVEKGGRAHK